MSFIIAMYEPWVAKISNISFGSCTHTWEKRPWRVRWKQRNKTGSKKIIRIKRNIQIVTNRSWVRLFDAKLILGHSVIQLTWLTMINLSWMKGICSTNVTPVTWQSLWRCESSSQERKMPAAFGLAASGLLAWHTCTSYLRKQNSKESSDREMIECKRHECMTYLPNERWKLRNAIMPKQDARQMRTQTTWFVFNPMNRRRRQQQWQPTSLTFCVNVLSYFVCFTTIVILIIPYAKPRYVLTQILRVRFGLSAAFSIAFAFLFRVVFVLVVPHQWTRSLQSNLVLCVLDLYFRHRITYFFLYHFLVVSSVFVTAAYIRSVYGGMAAAAYYKWI